MRRVLGVFLFSLALLGACLPAGMAAPSDKKNSPPLRPATGLEWLQMSVGERTDQILAAMMLLTQNGVALRDAPDEYYRAVHDAVRRDLSLYAVSVTDIVAEHAWQREPGARPVLDALRARKGS